MFIRQQELSPRRHTWQCQSTQQRGERRKSSEGGHDSSYVDSPRQQRRRSDDYVNLIKSPLAPARRGVGAKLGQKSPAPTTRALTKNDARICSSMRNLSTMATTSNQNRQEMPFKANTVFDDDHDGAATTTSKGAAASQTSRRRNKSSGMYFAAPPPLERGKTGSAGPKKSSRRSKPQSRIMPRQQSLPNLFHDSGDFGMDDDVDIDMALAFAEEEEAEKNAEDGLSVASELTDQNSARWSEDDDDDSFGGDTAFENPRFPPERRKLYRNFSNSLPEIRYNASEDNEDSDYNDDGTELNDDAFSQFDRSFQQQLDEIPKLDDLAHAARTGFVPTDIQSMSGFSETNHSNNKNKKSKLDGGMREVQRNDLDVRADINKANQTAKCNSRLQPDLKSPPTRKKGLSFSIHAMPAGCDFKSPRAGKKSISSSLHSQQDVDSGERGRGGIEMVSERRAALRGSGSSLPPTSPTKARAIMKKSSSARCLLGGFLHENHAAVDRLPFDARSEGWVLRNSQQSRASVSSLPPTSPTKARASMPPPSPTKASMKKSSSARFSLGSFLDHDDDGGVGRVPFDARSEGWALQNSQQPSTKREERGRSRTKTEREDQSTMSLTSTMGNKAKPRSSSISSRRSSGSRNLVTQQADRARGRELASSSRPASRPRSRSAGRTRLIVTKIHCRSSASSRDDVSVKSLKSESDFGRRSRNRPEESVGGAGGSASAKHRVSKPGVGDCSVSEHTPSSVATSVKRRSSRSRPEGNQLVERIHKLGMRDAAGPRDEEYFKKKAALRPKNEALARRLARSSSVRREEFSQFYNTPPVVLFTGPSSSKSKAPIAM